MTTFRFAGVIALLLMLAACTTPPPPKPIDIDQPVDAFNATEPPYTPHNGAHGGSLTNDVERLQDARTLYQRSRERRRHAVERRQRDCLQQSNSRRVPIKGAGGNAVFCEPAAE